MTSALADGNRAQTRRIPFDTLATKANQIHRKFTRFKDLPCVPSRFRFNGDGRPCSVGVRALPCGNVRRPWQLTLQRLRGRFIQRERRNKFLHELSGGSVLRGDGSTQRERVRGLRHRHLLGEGQFVLHELPRRPVRRRNRCRGVLVLCGWLVLSRYWGQRVRKLRELSHGHLFRLRGYELLNLRVRDFSGGYGFGRLRWLQRRDVLQPCGSHVVDHLQDLRRGALCRR